MSDEPKRYCGGCNSYQPENGIHTCLMPHEARKLGYVMGEDGKWKYAPATPDAGASAGAEELVAEFRKHARWAFEGKDIDGACDFLLESVATLLSLRDAQLAAAVGEARRETWEKAREAVQQLRGSTVSRNGRGGKSVTLVTKDNVDRVLLFVDSTIKGAASLDADTLPAQGATNQETL